MHFYRFLEQVKIGNYAGARDGQFAKFTDEEKLSALDAVPFVFMPKNVDEMPVPLSADVELDLPFKSCFLEMIGNYYITGRDPVYITGIWVRELAPRAYDIFILSRHSKGESILKSKDHAEDENFKGLVQLLLKRMNTEEVGFSNPRTNLKMKVSGEKIQKRLSRVIHISPKRQISQAVSDVGREIDWSHQWVVRGHWRVIEGRMGHDRDGNPIAGHTWVNPHTKGPENAPVIGKVRVVRD